MLHAIVSDTPTLGVDDDGTTGVVVAMRTVVPHLDALTDAERAMLTERLDRAAR